MKSSVIEHGASDISEHCNTINELKVSVHYTYEGERPFMPSFGARDNTPATKMEKRALRQSAAKCTVITKDFNAVRDLTTFRRIYLTFSAVTCGDSISQNMMLLLFHYMSLPLATPPLLWSKWLREAALMNVVNEVLEGTFPVP